MNKKNYIAPNWDAPKNVHAFTTTRNVGISKSSEDFAYSMQQNNIKLKQDLELPDNPFWLIQKHTSKVVDAANTPKFPIADASYTRSSDIVCAVLTADCLPILVCNKSGSLVAAIHAGWRGLVNGIIENTIDALKQNPDELLIWFGPAIGPKKFEVGEDVYSQFVAQSPEAKNAFIKLDNLKQNKWLANIYLLAKQRLQTKGINNIFGGEYCTYSQQDLFFSYRREKENHGHLASLIWLE